MKNPRKPSLLAPEQRQTAITTIINYFATERDEEMGIIAAEDLLDMFLDTIGKEVYNQGVDDTSDYYKKKWEELSVDIAINLKK